MNDISKQITPILPKENVTYRILGIKPDKLNPGKFKIPASVRIPARDTIIDKGDGKQKVIECIKSATVVLDELGRPKTINRLMEIVFYKTGQGLIVINPKTNADIILYNYMEICNYNKSNPNRDTSIKALFERIDLKADAQRDIDKAKEVVEAITIALTADEETLRGMAPGMKLSAHIDIDQLRLEMKAKAEKNPELFIHNTSPKAADVIKEQYEKAMHTGVIEFEGKSNSWKWGGEKDSKEALIVNVLIKYKPNEVLLNHLMSKDGQKDLDKIIKEIE